MTNSLFSLLIWDDRGRKVTKRLSGKSWSQSQTKVLAVKLSARRSRVEQSVEGGVRGSRAEVVDVEKMLVPIDSVEVLTARLEERDPAPALVTVTVVSWD
jgi:hypothetical protein